MTFSFSADHRGFYRDATPFFPKIQRASFPLASWSDAVLLRLSARLKDDLDWSEQKFLVEKIIDSGKALFWQIDFQFLRLSSHDTSAFFAYARAIEEFVKFSSVYSDRTFGVCLYQGNADFSCLIDPMQWEEAFFEWLDDLILKVPVSHELKSAFMQQGQWTNTLLKQHYFHLFSADVFAEYLHRLASFLPDTLLPFAFFDVSSIDSPALAAQLFSPQRFKHLHLGFKGAKAPLGGITFEQGNPSYGWMGDIDCPISCHDLPCTGIYLPADPYCDSKVLSRIDQMIETCSQRPFRIICEEKLTEEWDGLDILFVVEDSLSPQGKRKMQGFSAAGGEIRCV